MLQEVFEDTKGVIKIRKSKKQVVFYVTGRSVRFTTIIYVRPKNELFRYFRWIRFVLPVYCLYVCKKTKTSNNNKTNEKKNNKRKKPKATNPPPPPKNKIKQNKNNNGVDVVEWSRALDVRLSEWCCSVTMVWVQIPSREEQKFDSSKI